MRGSVLETCGRCCAGHWAVCGPLWWPVDGPVAGSWPDWALCDLLPGVGAAGLEGGREGGLPAVPPRRTLKRDRNALTAAAPPSPHAVGFNQINNATGQLRAIYSM